MADPFSTFTLSPPPTNNPKNQNFEKMKKLPRYIIILHRCAINDNHMMYNSWDMKPDGHNFLSFWTIFCPFTPLTTWKIKILKKWKKSLEILSLYTSLPYDNHMMYGYWDMEHGRQNFLSFCTIFCTFTPLKTWKIKIFKNWKKIQEILSFYTGVT